MSIPLPAVLNATVDSSRFCHFFNEVDAELESAAGQGLGEPHRRSERGRPQRRGLMDRPRQRHVHEQEGDAEHGEHAVRELVVPLLRVVAAAAAAAAVAQGAGGAEAGLQQRRQEEAVDHPEQDRGLGSAEVADRLHAGDAWPEEVERHGA
uniref:Uncharacterized protein n=1 Tax=Zea mays TaxID=4577 RepID=C0PA25_MAIZE|nr:unknown [Zea mays]